MGSFFTNVQVKVGDRSPALVQRQIIAALQAWARENGFEASDTSSEATRAIVVGPAGNDQWIPVYDELTETQYEDILSELCLTLSKATISTVVGIIVHDSDVLGLLLCENGKVVDRYLSDLEYFRFTNPNEKPAYVGHEDLWRHLLAGGTAPDVLRAIWDSDTVFAEDLLKQVAQAIGLPIDQCLIGFNYLTAERADNQDFTKLQFRWTRPVSAEAAELATALAAFATMEPQDTKVHATIEKLVSRLSLFSPTDIAMALKESMR